MITKSSNNSLVSSVSSQNLGDVSAPVFLSHSNSTPPNAFNHFVQFYETDDFLLNSLCDFAAEGIAKGEAVIVVATESHREKLDELLQQKEIDPTAARLSGQFSSYDARKTLAKLMTGAEPGEALFSEIIDEMIERAAQVSRRIRIFGEMVALLFADGNHQAAIRLEELWNDLSRKQPFSLFCAYPLNHFDSDSLTDLLGCVCEQHSHVVPAESYSAISDTSQQMRAIIQLQQKARLLEFEIEERKKAEKERAELLASEQAARLRAEEANRIKDEFLATVSHELRTPLNAILGWSHLLREDRLDALTKCRAIETIEQNARTQARLIEDMLDMSRVITGKLCLKIQPIDAASVINSAIDSVQPAADSKNIQIAVMLDSSSRRIMADAGRLQQIIWNLLTNSIKFTPAGGRIEIRLARQDSDVQISVSDTGKGITPDFLPFIFDRFRQSDGTSTRLYGGLGLGLAIVRHLVEMHGGSVWAESEGENRGATFTFCLPRAIVSQSPQNQKENKLNSASSTEEIANSENPLEGVRILLVDDNEDNLQMLDVLLSDYKIILQTATSAQGALDIADWFKPDILISDLAMPGEDGYSLIGRLRARETENAGRPIQAVALTAYARTEDRERALSSGFNMFVAKPIDPDELISALSNLTRINQKG